MDFYNTLGNGFEGLPHEQVGPFALGQLHSHIADNSYGDSLIHRQLLENPKVSFGREAGHTYGGLDEETSTIDGLLPNKSRSLKSLMGIMQGEIDERLRIKDSILDKIDYDSLYVENYMLHEMETWAPNSWGSNKNIEKRRSALENMLAGLQKEKRMEYVSCFRDLVFLKKDLVGVLREYWAAKSRERMLSEDTVVESEEVKGDNANGS